MHLHWRLSGVSALDYVGRRQGLQTIPVLVCFLIGRPALKPLSMDERRADRIISARKRDLGLVNAQNPFGAWVSMTSGSYRRLRSANARLAKPL